MKLSRPSTYALHALVDLANRGGSEAVGAREIAWAYGISEHLLSMALRPLLDHGILVSTKGENGGYRLARPIAVACR